ncbi:MAG: YggS family pyridoxal phosphate-dependent enzyme [Eubacteriales bacterium]|nr:YggS family pyridoxal phosphate-dependent enzyme [Eubacteriales bacterium]
MTGNTETIGKNIAEIQNYLNGRAALLAATKTIPADVINLTYDMGIRVIGENRVNELVEKYPLLDKRFDIHFIGRLQRNKVKYIIDKVSLIHSLDSLLLAEEIEKRASRIGKIQDCLVEINLGDEISKGGIPLDKLDAFMDNIKSFSHVRIRGLMGVLPKTEDIQKNIIFFTKITQKFIDIKVGNVDNSIMGNNAMEILSLGMSGDYKEAVECGSNLVRIGEGIFGRRDRQHENV